MNDFFGSQETARSKTARLISLFSLSVLLIIICVYLVSAGILHLSARYYSEEAVPFSLWNPYLFTVVVLTCLLVILGGTAYKINELKAGGRKIAKLLGGRWIPRGTKVPEEKRLYNVVEEMAVASGMPVPDLYVMDKERGINAFAAGFGPNDAVISVTQGTLKLLDRDELQGVIAHEFSHILNTDTLINVRLMGWLHGILMISHAGRGMLRLVAHARGGPAALLAVFGSALYALGSLGLFFGNLIKSA
ncbi:MAG TPA: M48 family metalloprotease, partial [Nitrospiria bacterium]